MRKMRCEFDNIAFLYHLWIELIDNTPFHFNFFFVISSYLYIVLDSLNYVA